MRSSIKTWVAALGLSVAGMCARAADVPEAAGPVSFRINAPTMVGALIQFSQQSGLQLGFASDAAADAVAPRVEGKLTPRAALEQLLKDSGLTFEFVNPRTVTVIVKSAPDRKTDVRDVSVQRPSAVR